MGLYISQKGGVVAAEELAPFLLTSPVDDSTDESYVLPALSRFGGEVEIDDQVRSWNASLRLRVGGNRASG